MTRYNLEVVIQQIIMGPSRYNVSICGYFDKEHRPLILVARQRIRQLSMFSVHTILVSIPLSSIPALRQLIVGYLSAIRYHGIFSAEFKKDARDNEYRVLEVNARSTWPNNHLARIGVNQVLMAYQESIGEPITPMRGYRTGVFSINLIRDIRSLKNQLLAGELSLREMFQPYLGEKHWLIYARDDPLPFLHFPAREIRNWLQRARD
jgi:predicted ATP-grasp superfamily ATP-dependent carboligase